MNYGLCLCVPAGRESPPASLPDSALWTASSSISLTTFHNCVGSNLCDNFLYIISGFISIYILVVLILWLNTNREWDSDGIKWKAGWENYANENIGCLSWEKKDESEGRTEIHGEVIPSGSKTVCWSKNFLISLVGFHHCYEPVISVYSHCPHPFWTGMSIVVIVCLSHHCMLCGEQITCPFTLYIFRSGELLDECI